jgi:hypothetical protein
MPWDNPRVNEDMSDGESDSTRSLRHALRNRGANTDKYGALADDEGLDERARAGFLKENVVVYGRTWVDNVIWGRVKGHIDGKRDT